MITFTLFIIISLIPIFTRLLLTGKEETLINWSRLIIKYIGIRCTILFWAFILAGHDLIPIVIGSKYRGIFPSGVILLLGMFPMIFAQLGFVFSVVYKEPRKYFQALCLAFVAFLVGSILFIPSYAYMGCAIATLISCIVLAVVICVYFREKLFPCLTYGFNAIALGVIFVPFLFFRGSLITDLFLTVCSVLTYILLPFIGRVLNLGEIKEIFQAIRHQPEEL
jgi:O-antigen/teichoic acid export membrane protein